MVNQCNLQIGLEIQIKDQQILFRNKIIVNMYLTLSTSFAVDASSISPILMTITYGQGIQKQVFLMQTHLLREDML